MLDGRLHTGEQILDKSRNVSLGTVPGESRIRPAGTFAEAEGFEKRCVERVEGVEPAISEVLGKLCCTCETWPPNTPKPNV